MYIRKYRYLLFIMQIKIDLLWFVPFLFHYCLFCYCDVFNCGKKGFENKKVTLLIRKINLSGSEIVLVRQNDVNHCKTQFLSC